MISETSTKLVSQWKTRDKDDTTRSLAILTKENQSTSPGDYPSRSNQSIMMTIAIYFEILYQNRKISHR